MRTHLGPYSSVLNTYKDSLAQFRAFRNRFKYKAGKQGRLVVKPGSEKAARVQQLLLLKFELLY